VAFGLEDGSIEIYKNLEVLGEPSIVLQVNFIPIYIYDAIILTL
jgi:hypothetical protein